MTDMNCFVSQAELELRGTRTVSQSTRQAWKNLPGGARAAFDRALVFLGCLPEATVATSPTTSEADRIAAVRLMLLKLGLDGADPRWSSDALDRLLNAVVETPGGDVGDLYFALFGILGDYSPELTKSVADLIKELVVNCFTRYRGPYDSVDWQRLAENLLGKATKAQLYLALYAIPPQFVPSNLADAIAKGLEPTAFHGEAVRVLAD